ncbi:MAG: RNA polymerase sigma-70 factor [Paludibacter sp.]|nr:RNA polymerase sigma-70 factor [Paludibacter sp.]MDD4428097.1 RNA polymerase sigma-70 factor [Paludibacter sp.]
MYQLDLKSFNQIFEKYFQRFVFFANSYVKDIRVAEDLTMEAFMLFWENKETLHTGTNPSAYILTIIKNKSISYLRHKQTHLDLTEKLADHYNWKLNLQIATLEACNPDEIFSAEIQEIVSKVLADLPDRTKHIFNLSRNENLSHKEISEKLNISTKGVEFHITKALKLLRVALKDYNPVMIFLLIL